MTRMTKVGRRAWPAGLAILLAAGLWWFSGRASGDAASDWVEVERDELVVGIGVTGTLAAVESVFLGPPQIEDLWELKIAFMAPEGSAAQPGMPVLGFDTSELERSLLEKIAERDAAAKELEKRVTDLEIARREDELRLAEARARLRRTRLQVDVPPELAAANELAQARTDLALAEREIRHLEAKLGFGRRSGSAELGTLAGTHERAAARVAEIEDQIRRLTVLAPRAGTVVWVSDWRGEKKKVGDSAWRADKIVEIPDLSRMRAEGEVDEADAGRVAVGQKVALRLDAHPDVVFRGTVRSIRSTVQTRSPFDPQKVVRLEVELDETDPQRMRPGMRFQGTVEVERVEDAVVAPAEAVFATAEGPLVFRRGVFGPEPVRPRLGKRSDQLVQILGGLAPGDWISRRDLRAEEGS